MSFENHLHVDICSLMKLVFSSLFGELSRGYVVVQYEYERERVSHEVKDEMVNICDIIILRYSLSQSIIVTTECISLR